MGEAADDLISGLCCSECGCFFEDEHGFPVLCIGCWTPGANLPLASEMEV